MNILILGNGFDLAHNLPTKYDDFLNFAKRILTIYTYHGNLAEYLENHVKGWEGNDYLKEQLKTVFEKRKPISSGKFYAIASVDKETDNFRNLLVNNVWFSYFLIISTTTDTRPEKLIRGENWIDFENEISFVVQHLDTNFEDVEERIFVENIINQLASKESTKNLAYFNNLKLLEFYRTSRNHCKDVIKDGSVKLRNLRDRLYNDLEDLISAFDFYLTEFVEKIPIQEKIPFVEKTDPSYVVSFNYTKTFEKQYPSITSPGTSLPHIARICHVHGTTSEQDETADATDTINSLESNIVIGIDEYWETPEDQAKRTNFAVFKKFIQRIRKQNDLEYVDWQEAVEKHNPKDTSIAVYIFGHSLNITDKEILEPFLKSDNTYLHIYARDKASEGSLVSNLITIIGREAVTKKSKAGKIVFERSEQRSRQEVAS